jgi:hypothetical protein
MPAVHERTTALDAGKDYNQTVFKTGGLSEAKGFLVPQTADGKSEGCRGRGNAAPPTGYFAFQSLREL